MWGFRSPIQVREPWRMSIATASQLDENTPFLRDTVRTTWATLKHRYKNTRKYIISKGALATLMWMFTASILYYFVFNFVSYTNLIDNTSITYIIMYGYQAIMLCFYPISGYLADNKYGRYKTVVFGLWLLLPSFIFLAINLSSVLVFHFQSIGLASLVILVILLAISTVSFNANILQLGMNQLYDFPVEDQSLFIHWYLWVLYLIVFLVQLSLRMELFQASVIYSEVANTTNYSNIIYTVDMVSLACFF